MLLCDSVYVLGEARDTNVTKGVVTSMYVREGTVASTEDAVGLETESPVEASGSTEPDTGADVQQEGDYQGEY